MLISLGIILIAVPVFAILFFSESSKGNAVTDEKRRSTDNAQMGNMLDIGSILEDPNDHDPDRDWLSKGLEDEFPSAGDWGSSGNDSSWSDSSDSSSDSSSSDSW